MVYSGGGGALKCLNKRVCFAPFSVNKMLCLVLIVTLNQRLYCWKTTEVRKTVNSFVAHQSDLISFWRDVFVGLYTF